MDHGSADYPIDLLDYLAIRLVYEAQWVDQAGRNRWGVSGNLQTLRSRILRLKDPKARAQDGGRSAQEDRRVRLCRDAWRLFHLAQFVELSPSELAEADFKTIQAILDLLNRFPAPSHPPIWLEALEEGYRNRLLSRLAEERSLPPTEEGRPRVQALFCIDARSEGFRRELEARGAYETFGFAGFFGVPIRFRAFDSATEAMLCPVMIKPKHRVIESPRETDPSLEGRYPQNSLGHRLLHALFHDLKANNLGAYGLIDVLSALFGLGFLGRTLIPSAYGRLMGKIHRVLRPHPPTVLSADRTDESPAADEPGRKSPEASGQIPLGFSLDEQSAFVESALRMTGLTNRFARLILFCAHGSRSENNPYASALDCGACGGNRGGPNARLLALMANRAEVRRSLRDRGLSIPDDTCFLAGEHNTTTDRVELYDLDRTPEGHRADLNQLQIDLHEAGRCQAAVRGRRLPGVDPEISTTRAARHVEGRSLDWSQVRPEWGLSRHAAFIIGRRDLTRRVDLEGRVFLHAYDAAQDTEGKALETIMTAPLVVAQWINMEYYFSAVDPWTYGSGSKVIHNVTSGVGVMLGAGSDLKAGLPMQSVMHDRDRFHEPMRLLALIEAPTDRIVSIIRRHPMLQRFFDGEWVILIAVDPVTGRFTRYLAGGEWAAA